MKEKEINKKKKSIKEILFEDRGNTNFKKIFSEIPEKYVEYAGFGIVILFMAILIYQEVMRVFFNESIIQRMFYFSGMLAEIFAVFYIVRFFLVEGKGKIQIWDVALFIMLIWAGISTLLADDRTTALNGVMLRYDGYYSYLIYASVYVCGKSVKTKKLRRWILRVMGITISLLSLMTIPQTSMEFMDSIGEIGENLYRFGIYASIYLNTNHFAYVLTIGIMALAGLVVIEEKKVNKVIALVLMGFNVWALIMNDTFGSYVAVMIGMVFFAIIMLVSDKERYKTVITVLTVFIAVSVAMNTYNNSIGTNFRITVDDANNFETNDKGGSGRVGLWKKAIEYIGERPVFGFGPEGLYDKFLKNEVTNDRPHNEYLQHAVFLGIPALLCYLVALISLLITMLKNLKSLSKEMLVMGAIVFAYCVSAFFGNTLYYTTPYYFIFLGAISACCYKLGRETD